VESSLPGTRDKRRHTHQFIQLYLDGKLDNLDDMLGDCLLMNIQQHLPSHLDKYLATGQDKQLYSTVVALSEKIGLWRHVYSQQMPALIRIRRILLKSVSFGLFKIELDI